MDGTHGARLSVRSIYTIFMSDHYAWRHIAAHTQKSNPHNCERRAKERRYIFNIII